MTSEPIVFVVDDDRAMRDSLCWLLESLKLNVDICFCPVTTEQRAFSYAIP